MYMQENSSSHCQCVKTYSEFSEEVEKIHLKTNTRSEYHVHQT